MEEFAVLISIVSLVFTCIIASYDHELSLKISKMTLEFDFFRDIYMDHLIHKLPEARVKIYFSPENKLSGVDDIINELNLIRKESLFFKFKNKDFYNELRKALMDLEDYLVLSEEKSFDKEERTTFEIKVEQHISKIYSIISNAYCGGFD